MSINLETGVLIVVAAVGVLLFALLVVTDLEGGRGRGTTRKERDRRDAR